MPNNNDSKYCPMLYNNNKTIKEFLCHKEKCAWWEDNHKMCAVLAMGNIADILSRQLRS